MNRDDITLVTAALVGGAAAGIVTAATHLQGHPTSAGWVAGPVVGLTATARTHARLHEVT